MSAENTGFNAPPDATIRRLAISDISPVLAILQESPEAAAWSRESFLQLASVEPAAWVAERDGSVAGFLIGRVAVGEFEILNMAVSRAYRGSGIGSKLLVFALEFSISVGSVRAYLEVRASNGPAISLYARHGFTECGRRTRYYREPDEDALLFSRLTDGAL